MSAADSRANLQAKEVIASLKSGTPLNGTVRCVDSAVGAALIAIELPELGERQVSVKAVHLKPGDTVVIQCVPNPLRPEHYIFRMAFSPSQHATTQR